MKLLRKWVRAWLANDGAVRVNPPKPDGPISTIAEASKRGEVRPTQYPDKPTGYADVATLFVDELILRYFWSILVPAAVGIARPWHDLCLSNPWLKNMPELWHRLTGYELSNAQLDWAANTIIERLARSANAQKPQPSEHSREEHQQQKES